ncbi:MAG: hypothetical protein ACRDPQ_10730 [Nocardioidaceae bacterium]
MLVVVREVLSYVARHPQASPVNVEIDVRRGDIATIVSDDGVGVGKTTRQSGLRNLRERANALEGSLDLRPNDPTGTVLEWKSPLLPG